MLHGKYDRLIPVEFGRELAEKLPNSHLVEYDGSHSFGTHFDAIDFIVAKVVTHLREYSKTIAETAQERKVCLYQNSFRFRVAHDLEVYNK